MAYDLNGPDTLPNEVFDLGGDVSDDTMGAEDVDPGVFDMEPQVKQEAKPQASNKHRVKIDKEEIEVDLEELKAGYQQAKASQKAFKEASEMKANVLALVNMIKDDPMNVLKQLNIDFKGLVKNSGYTTRELIEAYGDDPAEVAAALLQERIQEEMMTPEQKKAREWDKYQQQQEAAKKKQKEEYEAYIAEQEHQQVADQLQTEILSAITNSGLKPSREILAQVANEMMVYENSGRSISADQAMKNIKARHEEQIKLLLQSGNIEQIEKYLPADVVDQYNKKRLAGRKNEFQKNVANNNTQATKRQYKSLDELLKD